MACEAWKTKLDTYLDGELPDEEMRGLDAHVRGCPACSADALARVQMKRAIRVAGKRFTPSAELRERIRRSVVPKPRWSLQPGWMFATGAAVMVVVVGLTSIYLSHRSGRDQLSRNQFHREHVYGEIADLHVETLASSTPVDVVSTDRHTVKPWFQGKIPFAFNLPDLQNSEFSLVGGRMSYLGQAPGAHLIYDVRKHHISVFVFQERSLNLPVSPSDDSPSVKSLPFNMETWSQDGLRYFVIGDASGADIDALAKLFKAGTTG